jgi:hypothetical protein
MTNRQLFFLLKFVKKNNNNHICDNLIVVSKSK